MRATKPHIEPPHAIRILLVGAGLLAASLVTQNACSERPSATTAARPSEAADRAQRLRLVSITPSLTLLVQGLGRTSRLVGTSRHGGVEGVPIVADLRPHMEAIVAADPDLVLVGRYPSTQQDVSSLRAHGLQVLDLPLDTLDDARAAMLALGDRLQAQERAATLVRELDESLEYARRMATRWDDRPPRVLLVFDVMDGIVFTTGGDDHLAEILEVVGATNVAHGGPKTSRLSLERIEALEPEAIIHVAKSDRFSDSEAARAYWTKVVKVPATTTRQVHVWPDSSLATHGPALPSAIRRFVGLVESAVKP